MSMHLIKPLTLISLVAVAIFGAAPLSMADSFTVDKSVVYPGQTVNLSFVADESRGDDVYVAIPWQGAILFLNEQGVLTPYVPNGATPPRFRNPAHGSHSVLSFVMPDGFYTDVTIYQARGTVGSDLLAGAGNYDAASLHTVKVTFSPTPALSGKSLYATHCASCHGAGPDSKARRGANNPGAISAAIRSDQGGMAYLSVLSSAEISAIATWTANPL